MGIANLSKIKIFIPYWLSLLRPNSIINEKASKPEFIIMKPEIDVAPINSNEHISLTTLIVSLSHRSGHLLRKENNPYNKMLSPSKSLISYIYVTYISTKR